MAGRRGGAARRGGGGPPPPGRGRRGGGPNRGFRDRVGDWPGFVEAGLLPLLTSTERSKLDEARRSGNPYHLVRVVTELAEIHPVLGIEPKYTTFRSLPDDYRAVVA